MKKDILWGIVFSIIVSFFASGIITNIAVYVSLLLPNKGINLFLLIALSALVYVGYMAFGVRLAFRKNIFVKKNLLRYGILPIILWIILAIYNIGVLGTLTRKNIEHVKMNLGINYKMFLKVSTEDNGFGVLDKLNSLSRVKLLEINKIAGKIHDNFIENQVDIDQNFGEIFNVYEIILDSLYFYKYFQPVWLGDIEKEDMYLINSPYRKTCLVFNNITMLYFYYYYKNGKYDKVIEGLDKYTHVLDLFNMFPDYKLRMDILNRSKWILELFDSLLDKRNDESLYSCIDTFTKFLTQNSFIILSKPIEENGYIKSATEMNIALYDYLNLEKNFIFTVSVATPLKNSIDYLMSLLFLGGGTNAGLYPMSKIMLELIPRSFNTWEDFVKYYVYGGIFKKIKRQIESYSNSNWPNGVFYYEAMDWENEVFTELEIKTKAKLLKLKSNMIRLKRLNIGKLPEDPFTGETIKFLEQNGQIIFFSAGRNLKYENGKGDDIKIFLSLSEDIMPGN